VYENEQNKYLYAAAEQNLMDYNVEDSKEQNSKHSWVSIFYLSSPQKQICRIWKHCVWQSQSQNFCCLRFPV